MRLRVSPSELAADVRNGMPKKWLCAKYQFSSVTEASVDYFVCIFCFPHPAPQTLLDLLFLQRERCNGFCKEALRKDEEKRCSNPPVRQRTVADEAHLHPIENASLRALLHATPGKRESFSPKIFETMRCVPFAWTHVWEHLRARDSKVGETD